VKAENNKEMIYVCILQEHTRISRVGFWKSGVLEDESPFRMKNFNMAGAKELSLVFL